MAERKAIPKKIRFEVFKRDKFTCQYCGRSAPDVTLEVDHINPVANGGNNDVMNLITSCRDCNRGKGKALLSDETTITKQNNQLKEIAERKEQLELMLKWRDELDRFSDEQTDAFCNRFSKLTNFNVSDNGRHAASKVIKEFGIVEALNALDISFRQYSGDDIEVSRESAEIIFKSISGICYNRKRQNNDARYYYENYIKKVANLNYEYVDNCKIHELVFSKVNNDKDFEECKAIFKRCSNFRDYIKYCEEALKPEV